MDLNKIKRDNLGTIELDKLKLESLKIQRKAKYNSFSFIYNNKKYFFKRCHSINSIYNELLAELLAKDFGIKSAHYDLASYEGMIGTISDNFLMDGDNFYHIGEIVNDKQNNIESIIAKLKEKYPNKDIIEKLKSEIIDILIFDILIANHDRHNENMGIIENDAEIKFCPIYDNELMLDYRSIYTGEYSLDINNIESDENLVSKIMHLEDNTYLEKLTSKLSIISPNNITTKLEEIEEKIGVEINPNIKKNLQEGFETNYKSINNKLKENKSLVKIKKRD
ncbi:MAG: hypothetical protein E7160_01050 [Firmicutes bacterium]|nr:hypothetical protein [Bacillota bacterium]